MMQVAGEISHPLLRICVQCSVRLSSIRLKSRVKVPTESSWQIIDQKDLPKVPEIDMGLINHLERLSLVEFNNEAGVQRLSEAIKSANQLFQVDVEGVEPLDTVLEDRSLYLRDDAVTEGNVRKELLKLATLTEEDYYLAPPGNIPLKQRKTGYGKIEDPRNIPLKQRKTGYGKIEDPS